MGEIQMDVVWIVAIPARLELVVEEAGKVVLPVFGGQVHILSQNLFGTKTFITTFGFFRPCCVF